jgi:hypothetical protein
MISWNIDGAVLLQLDGQGVAQRETNRYTVVLYVAYAYIQFDAYLPTLILFHGLFDISFEARS